MDPTQNEFDEWTEAIIQAADSKTARTLAQQIYGRGREIGQVNVGADNANLKRDNERLVAEIAKLKG